jgi:hypothetical protein
MQFLICNSRLFAGICGYYIQFVAVCGQRRQKRSGDVNFSLLVITFPDSDS